MRSDTGTKGRRGHGCQPERAATFSKLPVEDVQRLAGLGVEGDAHMGVTVKHRSRVRVDASEPNLRQVHLIHAELLDELNLQGFDVAAGQLGENITTSGVDLLGLPKGVRLYLGDAVVLEVTGLRNPCRQLDGLRPGLMKAVLERGEDGTIKRKSEVMAVVLAGGCVRAGDGIRVALPDGPHVALKCV